MYESQFLNRVNFRDAAIIQEVATNLYKRVQANPVTGAKVIKICDYGAGDGRFLRIIEKVALEMAKKDIKIELVAYEQNKVGLEQYVSKAEATDYKKLPDSGVGFINIQENPIGKRGYKVGKWHKDNLTLTFIHSSPDDKLSHIATVIGNVDMTMCMFGVLSHIPIRLNRIHTLKMFGDITNGPVIVSVPGNRRFAQERKLFEDIRKKGYENIINDLASEPGDLFYKREDPVANIALQNYIHPYTTSELETDFALAKLKTDNGIKAEKIFNEKHLVRSKPLATIDKFISERLPSFLVDYVAEYMVVVAQRPRMLNRNTFVEREGARQANSLRSKL